jgi:hypothetical protein
MNKETLEEAAENYGNNIGNKNGTAQFDFIKGAKWQAERMYSEKDLREAFFSGCQSERQIKPRIKCWEEWFEQFKKK